MPSAALIYDKCTCVLNYCATSNLCLAVLHRKVYIRESPIYNLRMKRYMEADSDSNNDIPTLTQCMSDCNWLLVYARL